MSPFDKNIFNLAKEYNAPKTIFLSSEKQMAEMTEIKRRE